MARAAVRVRVRGRVQGVGYRAWCRGEALARGLDGWVRNEADGSVSAVIAGPEAEVAAMLRALQDGPRHARVTGVETTLHDGAAGPGFRVER